MSELKKFDEPIGLQRLRKLQILIETNMWFNKDIEFDMNTWKYENECGTTACLCGMYSIAYPEDGLKLIKPYNSGYEEYEDYKPYEIAFGMHGGYTATSIFFELSHRVSKWLFSPTYYRCTNKEEIKAEALRRTKLVIEEKVKCPS